MKAHYLLPAILGGLLLTPTDSHAQGRPGDQSNIRELFLKNFDKNGNGKIDSEERPAANRFRSFSVNNKATKPHRPTRCRWP